MALTACSGCSVVNDSGVDEDDGSWADCVLPFATDWSCTWVAAVSGWVFTDVLGKDVTFWFEADLSFEGSSMLSLQHGKRFKLPTGIIGLFLPWTVNTGDG